MSKELLGIAAYASQDVHVWRALWPLGNKRPKASRNHEEASENMFG